jgi:hypothetical protein
MTTTTRTTTTTMQFCVHADKFALPLEDDALLMVLKQYVRLKIDSLYIN